MDVVVGQERKECLLLIPVQVIRKGGFEWILALAKNKK